MAGIAFIADAVRAVLVAGALLTAASRPSRFTVQRSLRIDAPPDRLFALTDANLQTLATAPR